MDTKNMAEQLLEMLRAEAVEAGSDLIKSGKEAEAYTATRMAHLATLVGKPGYREALLAERDNVVLNIATRAMDHADKFDHKVIGIVQGALHIAAGIALPTA